MQKTSRTALLSLCAACAALTLAACGNAEGTEAVTSASPDTGSVTEPTVTEDTRIYPDLPDADFEGYEFKVAHWLYEGWESRACKDIYAEAENGVRTVDLEKYYSMTHPTTIGIIQNLEKKGFVEYRDNPSHARSRFIYPTEKALEMKEELEAAGEELEKKLTGSLSETDRQQLVILLQKMLGL